MLTRAIAKPLKLSVWKQGAGGRTPPVGSGARWWRVEAGYDPPGAAGTGHCGGECQDPIGLSSCGLEKGRHRDAAGTPGTAIAIVITSRMGVMIVHRIDSARAMVGAMADMVLGFILPVGLAVRVGFAVRVDLGVSPGIPLHVHAIPRHGPGHTFSGCRQGMGAGHRHSQDQTQRDQNGSKSAHPLKLSVESTRVQGWGVDLARPCPSIKCAPSIRRRCAPQLRPMYDCCAPRRILWCRAVIMRRVLCVSYSRSFLR